MLSVEVGDAGALLFEAESGNLQPGARKYLREHGTSGTENSEPKKRASTEAAQASGKKRKGTAVVDSSKKKRKQS